MDLQERLHSVVVLPVAIIGDSQQLQQLAHVRQAILPGGLGDIRFMGERRLRPSSPHFNPPLQ